MNTEQQKVNNLNEKDLLDYISIKLYENLNSLREMVGVNKLYKDESAESAVKECFLLNSMSDQQIESELQKQKFIAKGINKHCLSKQYMPRNNQNFDNYAIFKNFCTLLEENSTNKGSLLMSQDCYTHIGMGIKYEQTNFEYFIYCIISQKSICFDEAFIVKDGIILKGQMLEPGCYIYGLHLFKNAHSIAEVGPAKIFFNNDTSKFTIGIPFKPPYGSVVTLGMRKVHFFVQNSFDSKDIPYMNPDFVESNIIWDNLTLAFVIPINFPKLPDKRQDPMSKYLVADNYSFSNNTHDTNNNLNINNNMISNSINNTVIRTNNKNNNDGNVVTANKGGLLLEFDISKNTSPSGSSLNQSIAGNSKRSGMFFNPKFNNNTKINTMNTIPEENSFMINESHSELNSLRKLSNNLNTNTVQTSQFNNSFNSMLESQIKSKLGSNLMNAKLMIDNSSRYVSGNGNNVGMNSGSNIMMNNSINKISNTGGVVGTNYNNNLNNSINTNNAGNNMNNNMMSTQNNPFNNNNLYNQGNNNNNFPNNNNNSNLYNNHINTNCQSNRMDEFPLGTQNQTQNRPNNPFINNNVTNNMNNVNNYNMNNPNTNNSINQRHSTNLVTSVQNIPISNNFKSLLKTKSNNSNNFLNTSNNLNTLVIKDPNMNINLTRNSNSIGNNVQQTTIIPQSRKEFWELIEQKLNPKIGSLMLNNIIGNNNSKSEHNNINNNINHHHSLPNLNSNQIKSKIFASNNNINTSNFSNNNQINKSSIKFGPDNTRRKEKDNNVYTIDYYIFKEALNSNKDSKIPPQYNPNPHNQNNQIDEEKRHVNDKILETLSYRYLSETEMRGNTNINPVFEELYKTMSCYDIIITVKNEDITAHKVVLISQSQIFKEMIQKNENKLPNEIIKILLPETYKPNAFREVLRWIYCGKITENLDINFLREMLLIADNLKIYSLQRIIIVKNIIPNMTKEASIKFIKDAYKKSAASETAEVWTLLANFSLNCIAKNSSILIKNHRNEFLGMEMDLLFKCIEMSVFYLVEDIHLSNLIKIIIDRGFASDVFDLLIKLSKEYINARNHHIQNLDITKLIQNLDPFMPAEFQIINDDSICVDIINKNVIPNSIHNSSSNNNSNNLNNNLELAKNKIEIIDIKKLNSNSPATNYVKEIELRKNKNPSFSFSFSINYDNLSSCTIFSESFNTNSRSWNLKIDITEGGDVSVFLVERGMPILNQNLISIYQDKFSMKFNSILFEFEIRDISFEKSSVIFFSYVSDHNQIIGYENFFNVKQLGKKENFVFNIWIKEFPLHSACLQYMADNFQSLSTVKKENSNNNMKSIYDLHTHDLAYILHSDGLKVDNENSVLTAIYRYAINKNSNDIDCIMNAVRYMYIDLKLLCTSARDHETIKNSVYFKKHFYNELDRRIYSIGRNDLKQNPIERSKSKSFLSEIKQNDIYNLNKEIKEDNFSNLFKIRQYRERKYYNKNLSNTGNMFNITNELASFFLDKDHHRGYVNEIEKLKKTLEDEKSISDKRETTLLNQKRELQLEIQRLNDRESKRRKIIATASTQNINNINTNNNNNNLEWIKNKMTSNCLIF